MRAGQGPAPSVVLVGANHTRTAPRDIFTLYILCILWLLVYKSVTVSTAHISTSDRITDQYETGGAAEKSCTASP